MNVFDDNLKRISNKKGTAIVSKVDVPKGTIIFEFKGDVLNEKDLTLTPKNEHYLQIGKDKYIGPSGWHDDYVNHSCTPNTGVIIVGNRAFLIAIQLIKAGTEITFDYSTTSTDTSDTWSMDCKCGQYNCRKSISGYTSLPNETKKYYQSLNIIPHYLKDK